MINLKLLVCMNALSLTFANASATRSIEALFGNNFDRIKVSTGDIRSAFEPNETGNFKLVIDGKISLGAVECENIKGADFSAIVSPKGHILIQLPFESKGFCRTAGIRFLKMVEVDESLKPVVIEIGQNKRLPNLSERERVLDQKAFYFGSNKFVDSTLKKVGLVGADINQMSGLPVQEFEQQDFIFNRAYTRRGITYPTNTTMKIMNQIMASAVLPPGKSLTIRGVSCSRIDFAGYCTLATDHTFAPGIKIPAGTQVELWTEEFEQDLDLKKADKFSRAMEVRGKMVQKSDCVHWTKEGTVTYLPAKSCEGSSGE